MITRIAVLVSGSGTNLQALIDAESRGDIPSGQINLVISDRSGVKALERAEAAGIPTAVVPAKASDQQSGHFAQLLNGKLAEHDVDMVVLAGFLSIVPSVAVARYEGAMINIHPSLLPAFGGKGYWGLRVHEAALARGVKVTGATVHYVNDEPDAGQIIVQEPVPVLATDTPPSLQRRVMEQAEWRILPRAAEYVAAQVLRRKSTSPKGVA